MGTVRYTYFDGELVSEDRDGVLHDYMVDAQGSVTGLVDSTQTVTDTFSYSPFGELVSRTGTTPTPFQYVGSKGYYKDSTTRTNVRARNFNVNLGRWMTQDPIGFEGGDWNLYRYVGNNLMLFTDPLGKQRRRVQLPLEDPGERSGNWSLYRWFYTGDACACDNVYNAALDGGVDALNCMSNCIRDTNKQLAAIVVGVIGSVPGWPSSKDGFVKLKGSRAKSSVARKISIAVSRCFGTKFSEKIGTAQLARWVKRNPNTAWLKGGTVAFLWTEAAVSWYCAGKCLGRNE